MKKKSKIIFSLLLVTVLLLHFILLFAYCFSANNSQRTLYRISKSYVYPFFHQNWNLFVPPPAVSHELCVRYYVDGKFTTWKSPLQEVVMRHQQNRIVGNEPLLLLWSNSMIYFGQQLAVADTIAIRKSPSFLVLQHAIGNYVKLDAATGAVTSMEWVFTSKTNGKILHCFHHKSVVQ